MSKALFKLHIDCGRRGELEGVFIATKEMVKKLLETDAEVYFGEVLGKHSEIYGRIEEKEIIFLTDNQEAVKVVEEYDLSTGFNPFDYTYLDAEEKFPDLDEGLTVGEILEKI